MNHRTLRLTTAVAVLLVATIALWPHRARAVTTWQVIASGLDNPRGLTFLADGALYVAEAGEGGPGPCYVSSDGSDNASATPTRYRGSRTAWSTASPTTFRRLQMASTSPSAPTTSRSWATAIFW